MPAPRVCVLRAPGTNCDEETAFAFEACGAEAERIHLFRLLETPSLLANFQVMCIPGGFSYGDDVGAGVIFGRHLQGKLQDVLRGFLSADKLALGICNGFQVLMRSGILPGDSAEEQISDNDRTATLTWNDNGKYTALWVNLKVHAPQNAFLRGIDEIEMPIAHAEGRIAVTSNDVVKQWQEHQQVGLCYTSAESNGSADAFEPLPYPVNPNGSVANIAGLSDRTGRVLGLMPHPERFIHATQHPNWTRLNVRGNGDGLKLFQNAVDYFA